MAGSKSSNYKLVLRATVDQELVKAQLDNIAKHYKFVLDVSLGAADLQKIKSQFDKVFGSTGGGKGKSQPLLKLVDIKKSFADLSEFQKHFDEIRSSVDSQASKTVIGTNAYGQVNEMLLTYTNNLGRTVNEHYKLMNVIDEEGETVQRLVNDQTKAADSEAERTRIRTKEQKEYLKDVKEELTYQQKRVKQFQDLETYANKFLNSTKRMTGPDVGAARAKANELLQAVKSEDMLGAQQARRDLDEMKAGLVSTRGAVGEFANELKVAISRTITWGIAMGGIYGVLSKLKDGVQFVKDLDKEMRNIQIVTGMTDEKTAELANDYNRLAKELGTTTVSLASASLEYFRQGKTVAETEQLVKSSMLLSKLGAIESAQATEYLTSVVNAYKLEAEETVAVVDKLISADNSTSTSAAEVAEALQRSAMSAQQSKVSLEQLVAMISTVSAVSRKSASSIGESLNFLLQ